ncbi:hypothetical protein FB446DRAFT_739216 [Lentinula raphanica]|nr:hypothetical protein EV360DRAFT_82461 [Lentinula raphanica]KAJ3771744.1 hypothetical protein FB446DRAFT_739216 [Lentinula raphanica]
MASERESRARRREVLKLVSSERKGSGNLDRSKLSAEVHKSRRNMHHLPYLPWEVLHLIFLRTVSPEWLLISDRRSHSARNMNIRTKIHLVNVCWDWYEAGIKLLYDEIAIFSIGQLCALVSTLRANPSLANRVTSLYLSFYVSTTYFAPVFNRIYTSLPSLCNNLTKLEFSEYFSYPEMMSYHLFPSSFSHSSLTQLVVHYDHCFVSVAKGIHVIAANLVSLGLLARNGDCDYRAVEKPKEPLQFPRLQVLQSFLDTQGLSLITRDWRFPVLHTFIGRPPNTLDHGHRHRSIFQHILDFIRHHGQGLSTLFLHYQGDEHHSKEIAPLWEPELAKLVHLRHLIIPVFFNVSVPQVLWLDCFLVWQDAKRVDSFPLLAAEKRKIQFPDLRGFRCIDPSLLELPLIYILLPPTAGDEYHFAFPGIDIKCGLSSITGTSTAVREIDSNEEEDFDLSSGSGSDCQDYETPTDYESSSSSDDSACTSEHSQEFQFLEQEPGGFAEETWEADEEACLDSWRNDRFAS